DAVIDDGGSQSTLVMQDIAATAVTIDRPNGGNDLVITDTATGKTVKVVGEFSRWGWGVLQAITFADGVSWSQEQVKQMLLDQQSAAPGGSIWGYSDRDDTLVAGLGDKYLAGEGGVDKYISTSAGGNDIIDDGGSASRLVMQDIASTAVTID